MQNSPSLNNQSGNNPSTSNSTSSDPTNPAPIYSNPSNGQNTASVNVQITPHNNDVNTGKNSDIPHTFLSLNKEDNVLLQTTCGVVINCEKNNFYKNIRILFDCG